jgi:hypothetical protein
MADLEIFDVAQNHWLLGWPKSVYTSLSYYTTLTRFSSTPFEEFVKFGIPKDKKHPAMNPDVQAQITKAIKDMSAEELRLLYNNTGLCTAWAVQIAKATEMETFIWMTHDSSPLPPELRTTAGSTSTRFSRSTCSTLSKPTSRPSTERPTRTTTTKVLFQRQTWFY